MLAALLLNVCPLAGAEEPFDVRRVDLGRKPFVAIASDLKSEDADRWFELRSLAVSLKARTKASVSESNPWSSLGPLVAELEDAIDHAPRYFCAPGTCSADSGCDKCALQPPLDTVLPKADDLLSQAFAEDVSRIEKKIKEGRIPSCLLPHDCLDGPSPACREGLVGLFWDESYYNGASDGVGWIAAGSFSHLALADSFSCGVGKQKGPTCGIYSGATLMAHYCAMPMHNPGAARWCTDQGPGFRCVGPEEFIQASYSVGAWGPRLCKEDPKSATSNCEAAGDNPRTKQQDALLLRARKDCYDPDGPACRKLLDEMLADVAKSADQYLGPDRSKYGKATVGGTPGTQMALLPRAYEQFGFATIVYPPNPYGWDTLMVDVRAGEPVQLAGWSKDLGYPKADDAHAVVLESAWTGFDGVERVLVRDSNYPGYLKVFDAAYLRDTVLRLGRVAIGICPPTERSRCLRASVFPK